MAFYHKYPYTDFHELNLDWFLAEFKKVMDATESLDQTVEQFTQFVTNYFDNLDVQQEVNAKLEQMKDDGELTAMLWPLLQDFRSEIEGQMQEQDQQITDATDRMNTLEARMDTFTNLPNASTAGDAELQDIRIGADGYTYSNAGTAVRAQIDNLREDLHDNTVTLITGKYIDPSDGNLYNWSGYNCTNFISLYEDEYGFVKKRICIHTFTASNIGGVAFYDKDKNFISAAVGPTTSATEIVVYTDSVPDAYYIRISCFATWNMTVSLIAPSLQNEGSRFSGLRRANGNLFDYESADILTDKFIQASQTIITLAGFAISHPIPVMKGAAYKFNTSHISMGQNCWLSYCDASGALTKSFSIAISADDTVTFTADRNGYIRFNIAENAWCPWKSVRFSTAEVYDGFQPGKLTGKTILYNGDSIAESRFGGWTDNGGAFAAMIADKTAGHYINYAVSGGTLAQYAGAHNVVNDIANMDAYADAVCICAGVNDYWHGIQLGTYNPTDYTGAVNVSTVTGALEQIFRDCINKWVGAAIFFVIEHQISGTNVTNSAGYTFNDMRKRIIEICNKYSIPYVDMYAEGGLNGNIAALDAAFLNGGAGTHPDGCHPDAKGYATYYVPRVIAKLEEIMK